VLRLRSDGTVGANKNSIKIIADKTDMYGQGYFQYDSKKSGGVTISHLRFGKQPIQSQYFLNTVDFVALHKPSYIGRLDILEGIREGGTFLINCDWKAAEVFEHLTEDMQRTIIDKKVKVFTIDALKMANELGLGLRINSIMQACFFKLSGVLPEAESIALMKKAVEKTYGKKGRDVVQMNWDAIDRAASGLEAVSIPAKITKSAPIVPEDASAYAGSHRPVTRFSDLLCQEPIDAVPRPRRASRSASPPVAPLSPRTASNATNALPSASCDDRANRSRW
jgi:pyruvate-ferredoxin/flavodoxin oxidoreductase